MDDDDAALKNWRRFFEPMRIPEDVVVGAAVVGLKGATRSVAE